MADVGIFWWYQGQLLIAAVPLAHGVDDGLFVNGPYDHLTTWPSIRRPHPPLRHVEYEELPRGRVLFAKDDQRFYVYMDQVLFTRAIQEVILTAFHLPRVQTQFRTDLHYTTDPDELDRLFSR